MREMVDTVPQAGTVPRAGTVLQAGAARPVALTFEGVAQPVILQGGAEVLTGIRDCVRGWSWDIRPATAADLASPLATVVQEGGLFVTASVFAKTPLTGLPVASAVCAVLADLAEASFTRWPAALALHCGAVEIGGRVVAFAGAARAGKSTLAARLTAEADWRVFCDDMLPVLPGGIALGMGYAPRLRLPLPAGLSARFLTHLAAHRGVADDSYAYLPGPTVAPYGSTARLGAFVILDRRAKGRARFHAVGAAEAAAHLYARDMQDKGDGAAHLARVTHLAEGVPCLRLVYADLEDAVALLRAAFGGAVWPAPDLAVGPPLRRGQMARPVDGEPVGPGLLFARDPLVLLQQGRSGHWLVHRGGGGAFHLNPVAGAVWALLDAPATGTGIAAELAAAFPEQDAGQIGADVAALLGALRAAGLVHEVPHGGGLTKPPKAAFSGTG